MLIWLSAPQEMKVAVNPLCAMVISELYAHTEASHGQKTASSKLDLGLSRLTGRVKTLLGTVNLEMSKICPWMSLTELFSLCLFLKTRTKEDSSHAEMKKSTIETSTDFTATFKSGGVQVQVGITPIILKQFYRWSAKIRVNKFRYQLCYYDYQTTYG